MCTSTAVSATDSIILQYHGKITVHNLRYIVRTNRKTMRKNEVLSMEQQPIFFFNILASSRAIYHAPVFLPEMSGGRLTSRAVAMYFEDFFWHS